MEYQDRAEHRKALELLTVKVILSYWLYHMMQVQICWQSASFLVCMPEKTALF